MAVTPTYPTGILPWVNRIDQVNTVYANDPNTLAADLIAVESTLGTNPQIELAPPVGVKVTYANVSARIHDVQLGNQIPVVSVTNYSFNIKKNNGNEVQVNFNKLLDDFGFHNGTDITAQASGWYIITVKQEIAWSSSGYFEVRLTLNGSTDELARTRWSWSNPENKPGAPGFNKNDAIMNFTWQGTLTKGDRLSVYNINNTSTSIVKCRNAFLRAAYIRSIPNGTAG